MTADFRSLRTSFTTANAFATVQHLLSTGIPSRLPDGSVQPGPTDSSVSKYLKAAPFEQAWRHLQDDPEAYITAKWKSEKDWGHPPWYGFISVDRGRLVKMVNKQYPVTMAGVLELFRETPFELGVVGVMDDGWPRDFDDLSRGVMDYGFSEGHWPHGLACAFKGAGHDRLAHRRSCLRSQVPDHHERHHGGVVPGTCELRQERFHWKGARAPGAFGTSPAAVASRPRARARSHLVG